MKPLLSPRVAKHIADALREIGVLLIAFAPLDITLSPSHPSPAKYVSIFLVAGILLFAAGVAVEGRVL